MLRGREKGWKNEEGASSGVGCESCGAASCSHTAHLLSQNHAFTYDEEIKVSSVTQAVCDLALRFGESTEDDEAMMVGSGAMLRWFAHRGSPGPGLETVLTP